MTLMQVSTTRAGAGKACHRNETETDNHCERSMQQDLTVCHIEASTTGKNFNIYNRKREKVGFTQPG